MCKCPFRKFQTMVVKWFYFISVASKSSSDMRSSFRMVSSSDWIFANSLVPRTVSAVYYLHNGIGFQWQRQTKLTPTNSVPFCLLATSGTFTLRNYHIVISFVFSTIIFYFRKVPKIYSKMSRLLFSAPTNLLPYIANDDSTLFFLVDRFSFGRIK